MLDFPTNPTIGQQYTLDTRTWVFNGQGWARFINSGQVLVSFVLVPDLVSTSTDQFVLPMETFVLLNHI